MANSWPADYFISIHCNSNTNPEINGTEVYVYRANTQSYWLAQHILNGIVERVAPGITASGSIPRFLFSGAPLCPPHW